MPDILAVKVELRAFVREEDSLWVAACPSLDVYSQGDSRDEAKRNLEEAVQLWIDSCVERNTLGRALQELGWHRVPLGSAAPEADSIAVLSIERRDEQQVLGSSYPIEVTIPAYQAAALLAGECGASC